MPIVDDKRTHLKAAKHNRDTLRNNKLLPAIDSLFRCKDLNRMMDQAAFCLSIADDHERGADDDNCKTNALIGRWTKHEKRKKKLTLSHAQKTMK